MRYYGQWMRDEAEKRIGHLYPKVAVTAAMVADPSNPRPDLMPYVGRSLTVIAWLWARCEAARSGDAGSGSRRENGDRGGHHRWRN